MAYQVSFYIADPSLLGSKLFNRLKAIKSNKALQTDENATGIELQVESSTIKISFMPSKDVPEHLRGFEGYVQTIGCENNDKLIYTLGRLRSVVVVAGCSASSEKSEKIEQFFMDLAFELRCVLYDGGYVIDFDGEILVNPNRN